MPVCVQICRQLCLTVVFPFREIHRDWATMQAAHEVCLRAGQGHQVEGWRRLPDRVRHRREQPARGRKLRTEW